MDKNFAHCRWCGSTKTARSRLRWYDRWRTMLTSARPHRCFDCQRRFWDTPRAGHDMSPADRAVADGE